MAQSPEIITEGQSVVAPTVSRREMFQSPDPAIRRKAQEIAEKNPRREGALPIQPVETTPESALNGRVVASREEGALMSFLRKFKREQEAQIGSAQEGREVLVAERMSDAALPTKTDEKTDYALALREVGVDMKDLSLLAKVHTQTEEQLKFLEEAFGHQLKEKRVKDQAREILWQLNLHHILGTGINSLIGLWVALLEGIGELIATSAGSASYAVRHTGLQIKRGWEEAGRRNGY